MGRILTLFPAEPKLGPVYHQVTQFTPPEFPLLLIIPALALDLVWRRTAGWGMARQALVSGTVFLGVFAAVQWPFANFLASPAARNWFFGSNYFGYYVSQGRSWRASISPARSTAGPSGEAALALVPPSAPAGWACRGATGLRSHADETARSLFRVALPVYGHVGSPDVFLKAMPDHSAVDSIPGSARRGEIEILPPRPARSHCPAASGLKGAQFAGSGMRSPHEDPFYTALG